MFCFLTKPRDSIYMSYGTYLQYGACRIGTMQAQAGWRVTLQQILLQEICSWDGDFGWVICLPLVQHQGCARMYPWMCCLKAGRFIFFFSISINEIKLLYILFLGDAEKKFKP